jgi:hypothetical protein
MTSHNVSSERHALEELGNAISALYFNQRGEHSTSDWLTKDERVAVGAAINALTAARDRVHKNYLIDDPA